MDKTDICGFVAAQAGITMVDAKRAVEAVFDAITQAISDGDSVCINKFGTFSAVMANERVGRNPHTGEAVQIPARVRAVFKPSNCLNEEAGNAKVTKRKKR